MNVYTEVVMGRMFYKYQLDPIQMLLLNSYKYLLIFNLI